MVLARRAIYIVIITVIFTPLLVSAHENHAEDNRIKVLPAKHFSTIQTARFTLHYQDDRESQRRQKKAGDIATTALKMLDLIDQELTRIIDYTPQERVVLRFLRRDEFMKQTGAPAWTNAMFFRGEITIPFEEHRGLDKDDLYRSLRHEYVHALVADYSGYRCPAWLDEGLAQIIEGDPNPLLGPALRTWISSNEAMPLDWLDSGFTTLKDSMVPAAYAQSLFATRTLINRKGFDGIRRYLKELSHGNKQDVAFAKAFGFSQKSFEDELTAQIARWANSTQIHP